MGNEEGKDFLKQITQQLENHQASLIKLQLHHPSFWLQNKYFEHTLLHTTISSYLTYVQLFNETIRIAPNDVWESELQHIKKNCLHTYENFYENIGEKGKGLTIGLKKEIEKELLNLPEMLTDVPEEEQFPDQLENLVLQLKVDVKRGDRVTFKVLQELQHRLENMENGPTETE